MCPEEAQCVRPCTLDLCKLSGFGTMMATMIEFEDVEIMNSVKAFHWYPTMLVSYSYNTGILQYHYQIMPT